MKNLLLHKIHFLLVLGLFMLTTSCSLSLKAYLDDGFPKVDYSDLKNVKHKKKIGVKVEFLREGNPLAQAKGNLRSEVIATLKKSGLFSFVSSGTVNTDALLKIIVDNTGGTTVGHGAVTGLTGGLVGVRTIDQYVITATYEENNSKVKLGKYQHKIYATLGNARQPRNLEPMKIRDAIDRMYEEIVLKILLDLQRDGIL